MKVVSKLILGMGLLTCASAALAAPPPAPTITVAATDIKQLQFDITPVPTVGSYELWFKALPGAQWVKYTSTPAQRPIIRIGTSVHLLDWRQARYRVKACNPSGCTSSNEVGVNGEQFAAIGYFKPALSGPDKYFGFNVAVSADGTTMAVLAAEKIAHVTTSAAIHVYRKTTSTSRWRLEARLYPSPNLAGGGYSTTGDPLAISSDGKTIAFANWVENQYTGAVYLFRRRPDAWYQTQRITGDNSGGADQFGINVKLDAAGKTLVVGRNQSGGAHREGTLEVYQDLDDGSDQFVFATTLPTPAFDAPHLGWCRAIALSEVGHIVRSCFSGDNLAFFTQVFTAISWAPLQYAETARLPGGTGAEVAIDFMGEHLLVQDYNQGHNFVAMFRRDASGWVKDGTLSPFPSPDGVTHSAMSGDGKIVAVGWNDDTLVGRGPLFDPDRGTEQSGTVAIYERRASGWTLRRFVKADTDNVLHSFGWEVALNQNGHVLAVGSPYDASKAIGIDGDREDDSLPGRGAVWLY
ncbi:MAG TPA: hypothetical protein VGO61_03350 [Steroidobacteraceae bacterium]|nr:hypothetical protein [Steroidobacteraceae bacterium]